MTLNVTHCLSQQASPSLVTFACLFEVLMPALLRCSFSSELAASFQECHSPGHSSPESVD